MADYYQSFKYDNEASASSNPINLKLKFQDEIASPVYTGIRITGRHGGNESIRVTLVDGQTLQPVTTGPAASATVNIVLLPENFGGSTTIHGGVWTPQDFKSNIVVKWGRKKNLLLGDLTVVLKNGNATVGEIRIKHDREPLQNVKFRLGAMAIGSSLEIKEAITNPFDVKDRRNESKDSRLLRPNDKLWRLKCIGRKGPIVRCLESKGVLTVSDFVHMYDSDRQALREMCNVNGKRWDAMVHHAKKCRIDNVHDGYGSVGSTSQQANHIDSDGYIPQLCENDQSDAMLCMDADISVQDYEINNLVFLNNDHWLEPLQDNDQENETNGAVIGNDEEWKVVLAKKRWMKLRASWFSFVSFLKIGLDLGSTLADQGGSMVGEH